MQIHDLLKENEFILLDGAMGTELQKAGMEPGVIPETLNIERPELVAAIHRSYQQAGSKILYANTFGANRFKLQKTNYTVQQVIQSGISIAKKAAEGKALVALDIGPIGQLLEPTGNLPFDTAYDVFREQILAASEADCIVIETMTDLQEVRAAVLAAKENSDKPILCTMSFEESGRTFTGCSVAAMALVLDGLGVDAMGFNCSVGPAQMKPMVEELARWTDTPIVLKPNAGLPDPVTGGYDVSPAEFAQVFAELLPLGIRFCGGCCGTTPDFILALQQITEQVKHGKGAGHTIPAICTATNLVKIDMPRIIGERINPTGKKRFKEALLSGDIPYILGQAMEQQEAGADILDVNVGLPGIQEPDMMVRTVKALQSVTDLPLQIDSSDPAAIEAALRIYCGKAIVNSVNGEEASLHTVLPLVKKYGACVVGLTLDQGGVPKTAEERFAIAKKIVETAESYGIPRRDIFIDCLTLTASAEQACVMETLKALQRVKTELGCKTVLGVSNISFGLPNRPQINATFLTMALSYGLDLPILNPNTATMIGAVRAFRLLGNHDKDSVEFIAAYSGETAAPVSSTAGEQHITLLYAVEHGLKDEAARITRELLQSKDALEIVNEILIPALDKVGDDFEKNKIYLPQLISSAGVAEAAFEEIKAHLSASGAASVSKGTIVICTVKGDIHDIGKNIVKVILENYGYTVIDLGKDVEPQAVVDAALQYKAPLVGLSALMTTTLKGMKDTIDLLHTNHVPCKIMVGGAVLTPEYAAEIGADYYSKDAKMSADIAKEVIS